MINQVKKEMVDSELNSIKILAERAIKELNSDKTSFKHVIDAIQEAYPIIEDIHKICKTHGSFEESSDCSYYISENISKIQEELVKAFERKCK